MPTLTGQNVYIASDSVNFRTGDITKANISYNSGTDKLFFSGDMTFQDPTANITGRLEVSHIEVTGAHNPWAGTDSQYAAIYLSDMDRGILGNMGSDYARPLITNSANKITIGSNGTSAIRDINIQPGNGAGAAMSNFNVFTSGVKRMTVTRTGNIGFGGGLADNPNYAFVVDLQDSRMDILNGSVKIRYAANNDAITITPSVGGEGRILASDGDTSTPHPLKIAGDRIRFTTSGYAASTEVMRITAEGKVGIGTDDPSGKLDVGGDGADIFLHSNDFKIARIQPRGSSTNYDRGLFSLFNQTVEAVRIDSYGPSWFNSEAGNHLGIGTVSPGKQVEIRAAEPYLRLEESSSGGNKRLDLFVSQSTGVIAANQSAQTMMFQTVGTTRMTLAAGGSVGINVAAPAGDKLMVQGDDGYYAARLDGASTAGQSYGLRIRAGYNATDRPLLIENAGGVDIFAVDGLGEVEILDNTKLKGVTYSSSYIKFNDDTTLSANSDIIFDVNGSTELMRLEEGGNVGIGTNNPARNLSVASSSANVVMQLANSTTTYAADNGLEIFVSDNDAGIVNRENGYLRFDTNNTERVRILANGNVGIGTDAAPQKLTVRGGLVATNSSNIQVATLTNSSEDGRLVLNQAAGVTRVLLDTDGVSYFKGGNVGINVTDPDEKLEVAGKTHLGGRGQDGGAYIAYATLSETQGGAATILGNAVYAGTGSNVYRKTYSDAGNFIGMTYNRGITFHTNVTGSAGSTEYSVDNHEQMRITTGGLVGIGTDDPDTDLEVRKVANDATIQVTTNGAGAWFVANSTNQQYQGFKVGHNWFMGQYESNDFVIKNGLQSNGTPVVSIADSTNKVGIGSINPSEKLEVAGNIIAKDAGVLAGVGGDKDGFIFHDLYTAGGNYYGYKAFSSATRLSTVTDGVERLTVDVNGKVGIGTTVPAQKLHLEFANTDTSFSNGAGGDWGSEGLLIENTSSTTDTMAMIQLRNGDADFHIAGIRQGTNDNDLGFFAEGSEKVRITNAGNVGIGDNAPTSPLSLKSLAIGLAGTPVTTMTKSIATSNIGVKLSFVSGSNTNNNIIGGLSMGNVGEEYAGMYAIDGGASATTHLAFFAGNSTSTNEGIRLLSDGKVGLGVASPAYHLDVTGIVGAYRFIQDGNVGSDFYAVTASRSSSSLTSPDIYDKNSNGLVLGGTHNEASLVVKVGGNVGIGTNAPDEALDVVGFLRMGNATANSTQKIARQVIRAYNTSHNDFMALMGTANQTSNVISYGGGSSDQTCATELAFFTHTDVSSATAGTKRARINLSGNFSLGADEYLKTHNTARAHIQAQGTSVDLSSSKIADATLLLGNEYGATNASNPAYGLAIGVNTAGCSLLQSRRFNSSTFFEMSLNPYGGNVGIGTVDPGYKLEVNGSIVGTSKSFLIDHPTQTGKKLMHACIEGPENGVYFRGRSQETGIESPEYWSGLVDINSMTVDVTPIGPNQSIYVERIDDNGDICVGSNTAEALNYFYVVYGERKDIDKLEIVRDPTPPPSGADVAQ
jgi:hypothetical protein